MVPGLQSTPFAFADFMKAMRRDPEVSKHFQVWTFLSARARRFCSTRFELRQELERRSDLDPHDHDFATRHIVVLGHSMGGLIGHTLVSSSGERVWKRCSLCRRSNCAATQQGFAGWTTTAFRRNPRVVRAIFIATPHRGSQIAESWIGHIGASLIRLPSTCKPTSRRGVRESARHQRRQRRHSTRR